MQDNYSWCGPSAVRGAAGIAGFNWATMQGGDGFVALQDPTDYRIAYSESQDGNMVRIDRVTGETMSIRPQPERGRAAASLELGHAAHHVAARSQGHLRGGQQGVPVVESRAELGSRRPGSHRRTPTATTSSTMGVKGSDITHRQERRHPGVADDHLVRRVAEARRACSTPAPTTATCRCRATRADRGPNVTDKIPGLPKGIWVSEVVPSRFDEATVYATFDGHRAERLRDLHLREPATSGRRGSRPRRT